MPAVQNPPFKRNRFVKIQHERLQICNAKNYIQDSYNSQTTPSEPQKNLVKLASQDGRTTNQAVVS